MKNVLFVCTGNSARSIIAESIINNEYSNIFKAFSAGSNPSGTINQDVKSFLEKNKNYDLSSYSSKNFEEFINNEIKMDHVFTVCNNANNEVCPIWPQKEQIIHWDIEDPVSKLQSANNEEKQIIIRNTFNIISSKIKYWINEK
jgi:arsenate reductase